MPFVPNEKKEPRKQTDLVVDGTVYDNFQSAFKAAERRGLKVKTLSGELVADLKEPSLDDPEARELVLFTENDGELHTILRRDFYGVDTRGGALAKIRNGTWRHEPGKKLFQNFVDLASRKYGADANGVRGPWRGVRPFFDTRVRKEAAAYFEWVFYTDVAGAR